MYTLYKFHFFNGISEINQLFDDILIIWPAPVYIYSQVHKYWDIDTILTFLALYTTTMDFKWNEQDVL